MPPRRRRFYALALLFLLLGWLHSFEAAFWRFAFDLRALVWLSTSLSVWALFWVLRRERAAELVWLRIALGLTIAVGLLSAATFWVADGDQRHWPSEESSALSFGSEDIQTAPAGVTVLACTPSFVVFGRERGGVERFVETRVDSVLVGAERILPPDFASYAELVEPALRALDADARESTIALDFLRWQFPRQILLVSVPNDSANDSADDSLDNAGHNAVERRNVWGCNQVAVAGSVSELEEDNRTGESAVYPVEPLFEELAHGELRGRLRSYRNFLRYLFAPHDRRDLVDDPYFALVRHETANLEARIAALPEPRRAFLRARLAHPPSAPPPRSSAEPDPEQ